MAEITFDFSGRAALVTGAASGIGLAVCERLAAAGARVAGLDLKASETPGVLALRGDVTRSSDVDEAVRRADHELGGLDILVNSAGIPGASIRTLEVSDEEWSQVLGVNASGTFFACRAALAGMVERGYGRIVNVSSVAGKEGNPMAAAYSAAKAAVIAMTKSIGKDVAGSGVLVNCVTPAPIDTPLVRELSEAHLEYMLSRVPLARLGTPDELATLVLYLASAEMSFSTGAAFDLSGGRLTY